MEGVADYKMKKALVTGASRGIGAAIADLLRLEGYEVLSPSHSELDLSDFNSIEQFCLKHINETFDVLVNNAGINDINQIEDTVEQEMQDMLSVNLLAPIRLIKGLVPNMKKQKYGRIVNIGSIWGVVGKPGRTVYAATKHGIHGVTQTLAVELAPYNILVNTVSPGFTMTELTKKNNSTEQINELCNLIPIGRMADPKEQAKAVLFLVSENNTYITGQQLVVDGGYSVQ